MKNPIFASPLAERMRAFVAVRRLSGTDYRNQASLLLYFDRFLVQEGFRLKYLTRPICERYVATLRKVHPRYRSNQCSVIRQFSLYLSGFEPRTYVPEPVSAGKSHDGRRAYIYTKVEVQVLLKAAGELGQGWLRPPTYRTLIGLLYTTGLRVGEALALNVEDFHPDTLRLHVRKGKFRKARWVPLTRSTAAALAAYAALRKQIVTKGDGPAPLFVSTERKRLSYPSFHRTFRRLIDQCKIGTTAKQKPRVHDLRHTFAVHRVLEWNRDGEDVNARLPVLATYMGHVWFFSTEVYLQATPELYECAHQRFLHYVHDHKITKGAES